MSTAGELIARAFARLEQRAGFSCREDQVQLSLLLSDLIEGGNTGAFEAPTGLGKSLAALIPAIAHAITSGKRTVIATYTNVLAEQYWRQDLPLALSLFEEMGVEVPKCQFLIGRQRYACLTAMQEFSPDIIDQFDGMVELGIETEFRQIFKRPQKDMLMLWKQIAAPPVCPGRLCPNYVDCYYYKARRQAERAQVVITNHSVVIQDAIMAKASEEEEGLLGSYDFLIVDEAHDFMQAATNGLEFELSAPKLGTLLGIANRLEQSLTPLAQRIGDAALWKHACEEFRQGIDKCQKDIVSFSLVLGGPGILTATPSEVLDHPNVKANITLDAMQGAKDLAAQVSAATLGFSKKVQDLLDGWRNVEGFGDTVRQAQETVLNYTTYIASYGAGAGTLFEPLGVAVSYAGRSGPEAMLRQDVIGLAEPLRELIWHRVPYACLSATLALDGSFDFFRRTTGAEPDFEEILPSPFDHNAQAALYLPPEGAIPDPSVARREGFEEEYYMAVAGQLSKIILSVGGRTLALFHSRKEMEGVLAHMDLPPDLPILLQARSGAGSVGERFIRDERASLFALRSFWTGFDAPGQTLSCVALVRVPFEVPVDPPQIARMAWFQTQGLDAFASHTLPLAKMLMRQGAGRLIRRVTDRGVIALLDPRLQTKRYGEEILANLPPEMRTFRDIDDAVGWLGIEPLTEVVDTGRAPLAANTAS
jgi:ATP-dependent DNA helicase DinG